MTSAPGHPVRPRKRRLVEGDTTPRGPAPGPADVSSPSTLRDTNYVDGHARLDGIVESDLAASKSTVQPPGGPLAYELRAEDFLATPGDGSVDFDSPSIEHRAEVPVDVTPYFRISVFEHAANPLPNSGL